MTRHTRQDAELKPPTSPMSPMPNLPVATVFFHHSAIKSSGSGKKDVQVIDTSERGRGYICGAYHVMADAEGDVWEIRIDGGKIKLGAATKDNNSTSLAIVFNGNYQFDQPTAKQLEAAAQVIADWVKDNALRASFVGRPHKDVFNTACPGINIMPHIANVCLRAHELLGANPIAPTPPVVVVPVSTVPFPLIQIDWYGETDTNRNSYGYIHGHSGKFNPADRPAIIKIQEKVGSPYRDGIIDPGGKTAQAIYNFQKAHGLNADKKVGPITWHVMFGG